MNSPSIAQVILSLGCTCLVLFEWRFHLTVKDLDVFLFQSGSPLVVNLSEKNIHIGNSCFKTNPKSPTLLRQSVYHSDITFHLLLEFLEIKTKN